MEIPRADSRGSNCLWVRGDRREAIGITIHLPGERVPLELGIQHLRSACCLASSVYVCVCVHALSLSCVQLSGTPWTVARQAPLSMGFSRQEHWSRLPFPSLPNSGTEPTSLVSPVLAGSFFTTEPSGKPGYL